MDAGRRLRTLGIIGAAALIAAAWIAARHGLGAHGAPANLEPAPNIVLTDLDGRRFALSDYNGKVVLLDFWATWCGPCQAEIPEFVKLQKRYGGRGLRIVGISLDDDPRPVRQFYARFKMNYPVALGNARLAESFGGILGLPVAFLIDREGRLRAKHVGQTDAAGFEKEIRGMLRPVAAEHARRTVGTQGILFL